MTKKIEVPTAKPCPLKPVTDRIVVRRHSPADRSAGGILLPEKYQKKTARATVLAVGPGAVNDVGDVIPPLAVRANPQTLEAGVKVGDVVVFGEWGIKDDIEIDGETYTVLTPADVYVVVTS